MTLENLTSVRGTLKETFAKLDPNTIQHSDEITTARRTNKDLRNQWLWTADCALYMLGPKSCSHCNCHTSETEARLYLTRGKDNVIFRNIEEATDQLISTYNYIPRREDLEAAINSETTLKVKLSDLNLEKYDSEFSRFEINTKKYDKLNPEQRKLAEKIYGQGNDFVENMKMLKKAGINTTRVYVLNPKYVQKHTKDNALARACRLYNFGSDSDFDAYDRSVVSSISRLRGVPVSAVGDAKNIVKLEQKAMFDLLETYVAPTNLKKVKAKLQKLYKQ